MNVKYVVIDLSKIDTNKLEEMLTKAYTDGYQKGRECIGEITAPTIPYNGDTWQTITGYANSTNSTSAINVNGIKLNSCSVAVDSTLTNDATTIKTP